MRITETVQFTPDEFKDRLALRDVEIQSTKMKEIEIIGDGDSRHIIVNDDIRTEGESFNAVCRALDVPARFILTAPLDLSQTILERMLDERKEERLLVSKGNEIITFRSKSDPILSAIPVVEHLFEKLPEIETVRFTDLGHYFDARLVTTSLKSEPKVGDITRGGLRVLYSEIMDPSPLVEGFSERLLCTNGMTHFECRRQEKFSSFNHLKDIISKVIDDMNKLFVSQIAPNLEKAAKTKVDGTQAIRRIFKQNKINPKYLDDVLAAYLLEKDDSAFGVLQAFTRAANSLTYKDATRLQEIGGIALQEVGEAHCPECYAAL